MFALKAAWCYLAVLLDLYAKRIVGFAVADFPDNFFSRKALQIAYHTRPKPSNVLFHSDQGTHYTSKTFVESVASYDDMIQRMSHCGNCWDNALIERFFGSFKTEWMPRCGYENIAEPK